MNKLRVIIVAFCIIFAQSAFADPALVIKADGCNLPDSTGNLYFIPECTYTWVNNDGNEGGYLAVAGSGQLPEWAMLDKKATHWTAEELGFAGCFVIGDESKFTVTPKGRVNWWCRMKAE
jgi:hypothetical protein